MTADALPSAPLPRPRPRRARRWLAATALLAAIAAAVPGVMLEIGTRRAMACVASYEAPRGAELPDCRPEIRWFVTPSRVPWTAIPARYRAEELAARIAIAGYEDALVGHPDREAAARAAEGVEAAARALHKGSQRLALEELGRTVGAPELGRSAEIFGDRAALLARFDQWSEWDQRLRTLEAGWLERDPKGAAAIARRYAEFDPRDEELRGAVAASLCLGDEPARGVPLFLSVQNERASQRHENWARDWGDVRAVLAACAARAGVEAPPPPSRADAGQGDAEDARAALRLRLLTARPPAPEAQGRLLEIDAATTALLADPRPRGVRLTLVAALTVLRAEPEAAEIAELATPHRDVGEAELYPSPARTALDWLDTRRGLEPLAPAATLERAAQRFEALARHDGLASAARSALETAAASAWLELARQRALASDGAGALEALGRVGPPVLASPEAAALARSSAWYVAGDPARALAELDRLGPLAAPGPEPAAKAARALTSAILIQRAELLASTGQREAAGKAAVLADGAAAHAGDRSLDIRARWLRAALATPPLDPLRDGDARASSGDAVRAAEAIRARSWPWAGLPGNADSWLSPDAEGPAALDRALAFWSEARAASPEDRRALRYAAVRHRGDAPVEPVAYFALAGELLHAGEGDQELWLDTFTTTDARRLPLRTYAWIRAEAARLQGDAAGAARWDGRRRTLAALLADPTRAEIARYLGL